MYKIYVVEDEIDLNMILKSYLTKENYEITIFESGEKALEHINDEVHLWILDIMLKGDINGYDLIKKIREISSEIPVIFTSARDKDIDKILGLELGSDDYLTKPYSPKELVLRVNNIIKRVYVKDFSNIKYETYEIDLNKRTILENKKEIKLTTSEFNLLSLLISNRNFTFTRETIIEKVWTQDYYGSDRAVDDLVRRLRRKMPNLKVETLYGYGYRLL